MLMNDIEKVLITKEQIAARCEELGKELQEKFAGKTPLVVGVLKGAIPFMADIIRAMDSHVEIDFMDVSSYDGAESVGDVKINKDLDKSVKGESILLVEDIVDTGRTLKEVKQMLYNKGAADVKIVSLLDKPERRVIEIDADYVGFKIPNEFVVGYGLDYNQKYRNLPYIGVLKPAVYEK